jgi:excisionase family DNA binding protein
MSKPELSTLMTVKEVAEYLRISTQTVRRWARNHHLQHVRVGKGYRIVRDSLPKIPPQQQNFDNTERKDKP